MVWVPISPNLFLIWTTLFCLAWIVRLQSLRYCKQHRVRWQCTLYSNPVSVLYIVHVLHSIRIYCCDLQLLNSNIKLWEHLCSCLRTPKVSKLLAIVFVQFLPKAIFVVLCCPCWLQPFQSINLSAYVTITIPSLPHDSCPWWVLAILI